MSRGLFNFRAVATLSLGAVYVGALLWAMMHDRLDVQSFISGLGPSFGMALGYWFRSSEQA
jgi:hypothetical protein